MGKDNAQLKQAFLKALGTTGGRIGDASAETGISRRTYTNWRKSDPGFAEQCDIIINSHKAVKAERESRLKDFPIFPEDAPEGDGTGAALYSWKDPARLQKHHASAIREAMKETGLYSPSYEMQIEAAAGARTDLDILENERARYASMQVELSREGNPRITVIPLYEAIRKQRETYTRLMQSLGLNLDSKVRSEQGDGWAEFLDKMNADD